MARRKNEEVIDVEVTTTPTEYFNMLKESVETASEENLKKLYENASAMVKKYMVTGQVKGAEKVYNFAQMCAKELKVLEHGIYKYLTREKITNYIKNVEHREVKLIEMKNYEREIPDDVVDKIMKLQENNVFDEYFILFTDYTGKETKKIAAEKRDKDPILLGALILNNYLNNRLYYIDSWEDDKCDLTLDKLVSEYRDLNDGEIVNDIIKEYPDIESLKAAMKAVEK
jgi:hypothetical protein